MNFLAVLIGVLIAGNALAQDNTVPGCKLLSEGHGTKVWQCAPTPASTTNATSASDKK